MHSIKPQNGLASAKRVDGSGETIPWKTQILRQSDFQPLDFYAKCCDYYAVDSPPFVPVAGTREVMRVIEQCEFKRSPVIWLNALLIPLIGAIHESLYPAKISARCENFKII